MPSQTMGFEGLLEAVPDAVVGVDRSGAVRFVNHQAETLFGYESDDLIGSPIETLVPEALRQIHSAHRDGYIAGPKRSRPMSTDLRLSGRRQDGSEFPVSISLSPMDTSDGVLVIAAVRDMTLYEEAEADRRRADRLSAVVEFSGEAIIGTALDSVITSWNPAAERLYGYSGKEVVGRSSDSLVPEDRTGELKAILDDVRAGQTVENLETVRARKDGTTFPALLTISPIRDAKGAVIGTSTIAHDATGQRRALEATQRLASLVEQLEDAIISRTLDGIITTWNPAAERLFGYSGEEIIGKSGSIIVPEGYENEIPDILAKIKAGQPVIRLETNRLRKNGTLVPVSATFAPIRDADGLIVGASTIARDLTEQKRTFESARSMIETSLDSFVAISPEGKITDVNEATVQLTGVPRNKLIGTPFSGYFTDPEKAEGICQRVFSEGMAVDYPLTLRHRNGHERSGHETLTEVLYNASVYRDANGNVLGVFAAARDVTKRILAQREAAHQQAMEMDRLAELEHFQRITVGRELKMIELKKEIEYLKKFGPADGGESAEQH
jgi:PAS domain S-box-containing protein